MVIDLITKVKTDNIEQWRELRHRYIGGSVEDAVVGLNPFSSAYSLWAEKTDKIPAFEGNLATEVGTYLEEFVAKKFEQETGKKVRRENHSLINDKYPWAIANVDRVIVGENAGLEIKTTSALNLKRFKNGEYPENYYVQCVHYLAVTGKDRWYLAVLIGNRDFNIYVIERDEEEIAALMEAEKEFWRYVQAKTPPPADGSPSTTEAIKTIFKESTEETVDLSAFESDLSQYTAIGETIDDLKGKREAIGNRIKSFMGTSNKGLSEHYKIAFQSSTRRSFDIKSFAQDHPDIDLEDYYKESTSRSFKVYEI